MHLLSYPVHLITPGSGVFCQKWWLVTPPVPEFGKITPVQKYYSLNLIMQLEHFTLDRKKRDSKNLGHNLQWILKNFTLDSMKVNSKLFCTVRTQIMQEIYEWWKFLSLKVIFRHQIKPMYTAWNEQYQINNHLFMMINMAKKPLCSFYLFVFLIYLSFEIFHNWLNIPNHW